MTRPMPGPPAEVPHDPDVYPHGSATDYAHYCPGCAAEDDERPAEPKHLTDAECAAEYWRAEAAYWTAQAMERSPHHAAFEADVFERFAAYPHALEES